MCQSVSSVIIKAFIVAEITADHGSANFSFCLLLRCQGKRTRLKKPSWCFCPQMWKEFFGFLCFRRWGVCQIGGDCAFYRNSRRTVCTDVFWCLCGLRLGSLIDSLCLSSHVWIWLLIFSFFLLSSSRFNVFLAMFISRIPAPHLLCMFCQLGKGGSCDIRCSLHLARLQTHLMAWHKIKNNFHICMEKKNWFYFWADFAVISPDHAFSSPEHSLSSPDHAFSSPGHVFSSPDHSFSSPDHTFSSPDHSFSSPDHTFSSPIMLSAHLIIPSAHLIIPSAHLILCSAHLIMPSAHLITCSTHLIMPSAHLIMCSAHLIMCSAHLIMPSAHLVMCSAHLIMPSAHLIIRQRCSMSRGCASKGKLTSWGLHRRSATADARGLHTQPQKVQVGLSDFTQHTESTGGVC